MAHAEDGRGKATKADGGESDEARTASLGRRNDWRVAITTAIIGGIFAVIAAIIPSWSQPQTPSQIADISPPAQGVPKAVTSGGTRVNQPADQKQSSSPPSRESGATVQPQPSAAEPPPARTGTAPGPSGVAEPTSPPPAPNPPASACEGTSSPYRAEASVNQRLDDRDVNVTVKLTNVSDRQLIFFGADRSASYYGRLVDDSESNVYQVYANSTTAPRPPRKTPEESAEYYARNPKGGRVLDPGQTTLFEYVPSKKLGQQWRRPSKYTFTVGIWVLVKEQAGAYEALGDALSCSVGAR